MGERLLTHSQWLQPNLPKNHSAGSRAAQVPLIPGGPPMAADTTALCHAD